MPPGLFPQPSLDVEQRVGDVEPGIEQADVVTARRLKYLRCELRTSSRTSSESVW